MRLLDAPLDSQPQEYVEIDWGNPISSALVFAHVGDNPTNVAGTPAFTANRLTGDTVEGARGLLWGPDFGTRIEMPTTAASTSGTALSLFVMPDGGVGNRTLIGAFASGLGTSVGHYLLAANRDIVAFSTDASNWTAATYSHTPGFSRPACAVGRFQSGAGRDVWFNGDLKASSAVVRSPSTMTQIISGHTRSDGMNENTFSGTMMLSCWWNRLLTDDEIRSVSANPWQLFRPAQAEYIPLTTSPFYQFANLRVSARRVPLP